MNRDDRVFWMMIAILSLMVVVVLVYSVGAVINNGRVSAECLSYGYSSYAVTQTFKPYCTKRLNNSDVVVPLEDLRK